MHCKAEDKSASGEKQERHSTVLSCLTPKGWTAVQLYVPVDRVPR